MKVIFLAVLCGVLMWSVDASRPYRGACPPVGEGGHDLDHPCQTDRDCGYNKLCCQVPQGKNCETRYEPTPSNCPPPIPNLACFRLVHGCNNSEECKENGAQSLCCLQPGCGRYCTKQSNGYKG